MFFSNILTMHLSVSHPVCQELHNTGAFDTMSISTDENEHSIEMHLPYVAKVMERFVNNNFTSLDIYICETYLKKN